MVNLICFGVISFLYFKCKSMVSKWFIFIKMIVINDIDIEKVLSIKNIRRILLMFL